MKLFRSKQLIVGIGITIVFILLSIFVPNLFKGINKSILLQEYRIRGESQIDSSIVVLYLNNDDIAALGGWPLKRSYYALIINALDEIGVRAIGIDIGFGEPDIHGSEYDHLLSKIMKRSGNIVLSGYFRELVDDTLATPEITDSVFLDRFSGKMSTPFQLQSGKGLSKPVASLIDAASGFGHTVLNSNNDVPLIIGIGTGRYVRAFAFEVHLKALSQSSGNIRVDDRYLQLPTPPNGNVTINYIGGIESIRMVSAVEFLTLYNAWKSGNKQIQIAEQFKNATVLIGVIAEGRSSFISTPFDEQFPAIGIHALFIHNALHNCFIKYTSDTWQCLLVLILGLTCTLIMISERNLFNPLIIIGLLLGFMAIVYFLFATRSLVVSPAYPILTGIVVTALLLIYKHTVVQKHADLLDIEKNQISKLLQEKESKLRELEKELSSTQYKEMEQKHTQLLEEVKKYQKEIERLKEMAIDLQPAESPSEVSSNVRKEFSGIVYLSNEPMGKIVSLIKKVADQNTTVLLLGESGTGKELVARALHEHSNRRNKPFIAVNCGALTETLLESELFGHERGAFTGAAKDKAGRFELADRGTIFLDEIGDTSEAFQVKLLRVLQDGTFERVGSPRTTQVDVRVIAATNKNLSQAVAEKKFREDLFYRLNIFPIQLPPLRERIDDIPILIEHFVAIEDSQMKCSASVMRALKQHEWKGNVRELQSIIKRAVLMARAEGRILLRLKDFPAEIVNKRNSTADIEQQILILLREKNFSKNSISETADDVGKLNRGTVAEYFRGYCFKTFVESKWNISETVKSIAATEDKEVIKKVEKKLSEYLKNAIEFVDQSETLERVNIASKPKYKNLPQKYHQYLDEIISAAHRKDWIP